MKRPNYIRIAIGLIFLFIHVFFLSPLISNSSLSFQIHPYAIFLQERLEYLTNIIVHPFPSLSSTSTKVDVTSHQTSQQCEEKTTTGSKLFSIVSKDFLKTLGSTFNGETMINLFSTSPEFLKGKTILITGASLGIGKALARESCRFGASHLILASRNAKRLQKVTTVSM